VSRRELEQELEQVRKHGYAIASDELEVGFTALAAPVRNHFGNVVAAISINGPSTRLKPQVLRTMVEPVCRAADRVSRRLGATQAMLESPAAPRKRENAARTEPQEKSRATANSR
jgi:DNA-binding IclR family transcriptional regulator